MLMKSLMINERWFRETPQGQKAAASCAPPRLVATTTSPSPFPVCRIIVSISRLMSWNSALCWPATRLDPNAVSFRHRATTPRPLISVSRSVLLA